MARNVVDNVIDDKIIDTSDDVNPPVMIMMKYLE